MSPEPAKKATAKKRTSKRAAKKTTAAEPTPTGAAFPATLEKKDGGKKRRGSYFPPT